MRVLHAIAKAGAMAVLWLALGVVLSVPLTWALAFLPAPSNPTSQFLVHARGRSWNGEVFATRSRCVVQSRAIINPTAGGWSWTTNRVPFEEAPAWSVAATDPDELLSHPLVIAEDRALGWPMLALRSRTWTWRTAEPVPQTPFLFRTEHFDTTSTFRLGQQAPPRTVTTKAVDVVSGRIDIAKAKNYLPARVVEGGLPYLPIWPGFLANAVIFGGAAWAALQISWLARRWWRGHTGRCKHCGYSLAGLVASSTCPECGKPIHVSVTTSKSVN